MAKESRAKEKLTMKLEEYVIDVQMENIRETDAKDAYLCTKLSELGPTSVATDPKYYEVEVDGWLFWVNRETLEIISQGKAEPVYPEKIEVTNKNIEVYIGEGKVVDLKLTPNNASKRFIKYTSANEEIATVNNGVVTGIKEGTTEITIESTEDESIKDTCTVTVKEIELTGISLNKEETTIGIGKTEMLTVTYTPSNATYKEIKWMVEDSTIATVDENTGLITGVKAGEMTVTATSVKYPNIKAECKIKIMDILEISSVEELKEFRDNVNKNGKIYEGAKVILTKDLDLNPGKYTVGEDGTVTYDESAEQWEAISTENNYFKGDFDGKGHTIRGVYINKPDEKYQGFFGAFDYASTAHISNLVLKDVYIYGANYTGGIAGCGNAIIEKCGVTGNIKCTATNLNTNGGGYIGGIIGVLRGTVKNCYNGATISATGNYDVGGIAGEVSSGYISNCYNYGKVNGYINVGGISGDMGSHSINNCYNVANIKATKTVGGVVGVLYSSMNNMYNSGKVEGNERIGGIIGSYAVQQSGKIVENCYCTEESATDTIGVFSWSEGTRKNIEKLSTLPSILDIINGDNAFKLDNDGKIILNFDN